MADKGRKDESFHSFEELKSRGPSPTRRRTELRDEELQAPLPKLKPSASEKGLSDFRGASEWSVSTRGSRRSIPKSPELSSLF